jgi:hypothetical protein
VPHQGLPNPPAPGCAAGVRLAFRCCCLFRFEPQGLHYYSNHQGTHTPLSMPLRPVIHHALPPSRPQAELAGSACHLPLLVVIPAPFLRFPAHGPRMYYNSVMVQPPRTRFASTPDLAPRLGHCTPACLRVTTYNTLLCGTLPCLAPSHAAMALRPEAIKFQITAFPVRAVVTCDWLTRSAAHWCGMRSPHCSCVGRHVTSDAAPGHRGEAAGTRLARPASTAGCLASGCPLAGSFWGSWSDPDCLLQRAVC